MPDCSKFKVVDLIGKQTYNACVDKCDDTGGKLAILRSANDYECVTNTQAKTTIIWTGMSVHKETGIVDPFNKEQLENFAPQQEGKAYGGASRRPKNATFGGPVFLAGGFYVLSTYAVQPSSEELVRCACRLGR